MIEDRNPFLNANERARRGLMSLVDISRKFNVCRERVDSCHKAGLLPVPVLSGQVGKNQQYLWKEADIERYYRATKGKLVQVLERDLQIVGLSDNGMSKAFHKAVFIKGKRDINGYRVALST